MRPVLIAIAAIATVALTPTPAMGRAVNLGKYTPTEIARICKAVKGTPINKGGVYGCKKKCSGGTCEVLCVPGLDCVGTTPSPRVASDPRRVREVLTNTLPRDARQR